MGADDRARGWLAPHDRLFPRVAPQGGLSDLIDGCIDKGVQRVIALSTDKASSPINLYGATKLASDKLFVAGSSYAAAYDTRFAVADALAIVTE